MLYGERFTEKKSQEPQQGGGYKDPKKQEKTFKLFPTINCIKESGLVASETPCWSICVLVSIVNPQTDDISSGLTSSHQEERQKTTKIVATAVRACAELDR